MISAMTLGQLIAAQNPRPALKGLTRRRINLSDFADVPEALEPQKKREPVGKQCGRLLVHGLSEAMLELNNHECVGVEVKPHQNYRHVQKWAHTYGQRHGMRVSVTHQDGIVWITERED